MIKSQSQDHLNVQHRKESVTLSGYTVTFSIDMIDEITDNPDKYKTWQLREAINDARTHYEYGNASKDWYQSVLLILSSYV